ncbi:GntR family transcriptional regulator [Cognatishimia sp. SS12]|uniref:GntR family transcriptional regulator n=1 Tax=Cognatishimia sp. SS12 TaxID=2979465 RepID=UPI00232BF728|nr:GntR family transcriptional regulator [Cognatishimia sp. SS12]MDC0739616.1 GntR family transcriptional regulator [Cognatishimia sp. SS12]
MNAANTSLNISAGRDSSDSANTSKSIYEKVRHEILAGRLKANERLKISELAKRYGSSTNPVREALQQLRGEGLVLFVANQGARVRAIDMDFVRDVSEVGLQLEPYLVRWFVETATQDDIDALEAIQTEIETLNFTDKEKHSILNEEFHQRMYVSHYNRVAYKLWKQHREILSSISTRIPIAIGRREAILNEHRQIIEAIRSQDPGKTAKVLYAHIEDASRHLVDQLRIEENRNASD